MKRNLETINNYFSLIKFSHTIFAMPFAFIGFFVAITLSNTPFKWESLLFVIACMVLARNAAMAFNRYLDRDIDKLNIRTSTREIPDGKINSSKALLFVIINSLLFIAVTYFINNLVFFLSPVALIVILGYSYTKKFTSLAHIVLGLGLSLAPVGAYLTVTGGFNHLLPILFGLITLFWVSGFDIVYSLQDEDFDKENNLKSIPALLGKKNALIFSLFLHFITACIIVFIGFYQSYELLYWIGSGIFIALLIYQHIIIKVYGLSKINLAFFTTNGIGSIIYSLFVILEIIK